MRAIIVEVHVDGVDVDGALCRTFGDEDLNRLDHDNEVLDEAVVLDVHEVVDELIVGRGVVLGEDLGEAGDAGLDVVAVGVLGVSLGELVDEIRALGPRADEAHVADEDVPNLRQFVEACRADEGSDFRDARVVVGRELRAGVFFGVDAHGAEFIDLIILAEAANADLAVERRTAVFHLDGDGNESHDGQGQDKGDARECDVDHAFQDALLKAQAQALWPEYRDIVNFLQDGTVAEDLVTRRHDVGLDFLIRAVVDDVRPHVHGNARAEDDDVNVVCDGFPGPVFLAVEADTAQAQLELRLCAHAVVDVLAFFLIADDHDVAHRVYLLLVVEQNAAPDTEQHELHARARGDEDARIRKFMDDETQGHNHGEDQEQADGQREQDFAVALVRDGIEPVDHEHHDGEDDDHRKHIRVQKDMLLQGFDRNDEDGHDDVRHRNDADVPQ